MSTLIKNPLLICKKCQLAPLPWDEPYECISCGYLYCIKCSENDISCVNCSKKSFKASKLAKRILGNKIVTCEYCNKSGILYSELKNHIVLCTKWIYNCHQPYCDFTGTQFDFINHIQLNHEKQLIKYFHKFSQYNVNINNQKEIGNSNVSKKSSKKGKDDDCCIY